MNRRFAIGTVQFGMPYGVSNRNGQVNPDETKSIMAYAWDQGIDTLDTAIAYGESEERLGHCDISHWKAITKLPNVPDSCTDISTWINESVLASLKRLKIKRLDGLLMHRPEQLLSVKGDEIYRALIELKHQGLVEKIGVSISGAAELDALCSAYSFDLIQAPFNIIDRRLLTSGWLARLHQMGTEVHARSIFLQGLLLMEANKRPLHFQRWQTLWHHWHHWLDENQLTPIQACLNFALSQAYINRIVVGVQSVKQLQDILMTKIPTVLPPDTLMNEDLDLINPSHWSKY